MVEYPMTDQDKLNFKEKYENNPVAFIEDFYPDIELHTYQKLFLNELFLKDKIYYYMPSRSSQKKWLANIQLEAMKKLQMNFQIWSPIGIDVYKKGVFIKTLKHKGDK